MLFWLGKNGPISVVVKMCAKRSMDNFSNGFIHV